MRIEHLCAVAVAVLLLHPAVAADRRADRESPVKDHPGFVDPSGLAEMADRDGRLLEVTLGPRMLRLFSSRANVRHEAPLVAILRNLKAINAVIAEVDDHREDAERHLGRIADRVEQRGWERFVHIREGRGEQLKAFIHASDDDEVDGLLVLGFGDDREMIFVNLVGQVDMERIFMLGEHMGLPGLESVPPRSEWHEGEGSGAR